ncbi:MULTISPECIES: hypothetical protein [Actinosynnema]|uniref:hypothetical protein n=1 Tax=Actinosynnema TaxID=40566 RepID=UPI0020A53DEB|nr:hypothetical protein [Actinosynnema pretiosum]MCP2097394.1 hypothetical protein [Actinosynnema pretiosum]
MTTTTLRVLRDRRRRRVACRDGHGLRSWITPSARPDGAGVRLDTCLGTLLLTPLEVGRLRARLAEEILASETTPPRPAGDHRAGCRP